MKRLIILVIFLIAINGCYAQNPEAVLSKDHKIDSTKVILPDESYQRINQVISQIFSNYHYRKQTINDSLSYLIFDEYLKNLDNNKLYFLASDLESFTQYREQFDNFVIEGKLDVPFQIFNLYKKRVDERIRFVNKLLSKEFDFTIDEVYKPDRTDATWANSKEAAAVPGA